MLGVLLDLMLPLACLRAIRVLLDKYNGFRGMGLQVFGPLSLLVLVPAVDHMIGTSRIQATVATAYHIDEPWFHKR